MGLGHSPKIVTDGLKGIWDAANFKSYPKSGTTLYDATLRGPNGTLTNSPTYSDDRGGSFVFDATNNRSIDISYFHTAAETLIVWAKSATTNWNTPGWISSARFANGHIIHPNSGAKTVTFYVYNSGGGTSAIGTYTISDITIPHMYALTTNGSNSHNAYVDDVTAVTSTASIGRTNSASSAVWSLGLDQFGGRNGNGSIYYIMKYDRQLSQLEILQNFNALRGRFGI